MGSNIIVRKVKLFPVGDKDEVSRVYTYIRDGMKAQNMAMNQMMSALYAAMMCDQLTKENQKELNKFYGRVSDSKRGSAYDESLQFAKGLGTTAEIKQRVNADFNTAMKKGLKYGRISLPSYRDTNPLIAPRDYVRLRSDSPKDCGIYHPYDDNKTFVENLSSDTLETFIKFANGITFKVVYGNPHKSRELRTVFSRIFNGQYDVRGSSIEISGKNIILNLTLETPKETAKLDDSVVVGVDLGIAVPAVCALNTNDYVKKSLGSVDEFLRVRTKIQAEKRRLQKQLVYTSGGHGRNKKLSALDKFSEYEKNWVRTYNHTISRQVVDFALDNKAKYINLEDLSGFGERTSHNFILRNWSYYQLQKYIEEKASRVGIVVRYVDAYHTSQNCSCCGHWEEGQRVDQSHFVCKKCGATLNADFNAARNIAMSTSFIEG